MREAAPVALPGMTLAALQEAVKGFKKGDNIDVTLTDGTLEAGHVFDGFQVVKGQGRLSYHRKPAMAGAKPFVSITRSEGLIASVRKSASAH